MLQTFCNYIEKDFSNLKNAKLLLAVSGGVDSVVLAHLCKKANLNFALAHCNFNLRGEESDGDEDFVISLADELNVEVFVEYFDTEQYAEDEKISIQMAARELRYDWFLNLKNDLDFDYILTAHHANDNLETFIINLIRGTGLDGFTGIAKQNHSVLRPLLPFTRPEIESYAKENNFSWREDSSNASTKYQRNKIRHQIVPIMEEINPQLLEGFKQTQKHLEQSAALLEDYTAMLFKEIVSKKGDAYLLSIEKLQQVTNPKAVLYQLLNGFGFTAWDDIHNLLEAQPGKVVFSASHRLVKDREHLILSTVSLEAKEEVFFISEKEKSVNLPIGRIDFEEVDEIGETAENIAYFDKDELTFPLKVRKWEAGDVFYPFGMKGTKKLSDFFANKKLSLPEKDNVWILFSEEKIVWIVNYRPDNRFKVDENTHSILKVTFTQ